MNNFIEFKNVTKGYKIGDKTYNALDNVSFSLPKGEFVCILGPSGAGKSTLLNLLGGMDTVTSGDIIIDKENISKKSDKFCFISRNIFFLSILPLYLINVFRMFIYCITFYLTIFKSNYSISNFCD